MDIGRLAKLTKAAADVTGSAVTDLDTHYDRKALKRVRAIPADPSHPLYSELANCRTKRETSARVLSVRVKIDRFRKSFVPTVVSLFNKEL